MKLFHSFRLDFINHCLWREEDRVPLTPKAFDVLRYLVEHADRLVTQDEILSALWPEIYVNPEVIKKYVLEIRKALSDSADKPKFIATFPRRGYQFIAPVTETITDSPLLAKTTVSTAQKIVGRALDMAQLQGFLSQALRAQRQLVFITGEAGVGKTTLLDAFQQSIVGQQILRVFRGQCVEGFGGKEAYYPVLEALSQWLQGSHSERIIHALEKRAPTWLIQFPSLVKPEQREILQKEIIGATRERMVREICEALESVTAQDPLVLILEDLHWVDPSTLDFLSALARRRGPAKLLLLGTYRPAEVIISQSPLKLLKQDLVIHNLAQEVSLERLEETDVAEYLALSFADHHLPDGFSNLIYRHSGGNALFMVTILQDMIKDKLLAKSDGQWSLTVPLQDVDLRVPETLDQLIEMQFQQLSAAEQRILKSASVAGERFSVWAITDVAEMDAVAVEDACEALADRLQFIKAVGTHKSCHGQLSAYFEFRHSLYREVLYRRLSESARSKLHLHLAKRLKKFSDAGEQEMANELAVHFEGGRDYQEAIRYLVLSAENAAGRFAYRDSIEILQHALSLVDKLDATVGANFSIQIFELIGDSQFALGALPESAHAYETSALHADKAGLKTAQVHALICAMYPLGFIDPDQGINAMGQALEMSKIVGEPLLIAHAQVLSAGCRLVFDTWRRDEAESCVENYKILSSQNEVSDRYVKMSYAHVLTLQGDYRQAIQILDADTFQVERGNRLIPHFGAISAKTIALLRLGQLGEVLKIVRAGREAADDNLARSWLLSFREAWLRILAFDYAGAHRICGKISEASAHYHPGQPQTIGFIAAGYMALERKEYSQAIHLFKQVHSPEVVTKFFLHWMWRLVAGLELGNAWLLSGNIPEARCAADSFLKSALLAGDPHLQALAWDLDARVATAENNPEDAQESIDQALALVDKFEIPVAAWQVHATAAHLYAQLKDPKKANANRKQAENNIRKIADSFAPDEPLRTTFLAAPAARAILAQSSASEAARTKKLKGSAAPLASL